MANEIINFRKVSTVNETTDPVYLENGEVSEFTNLVLDHSGAFGTPVRRGRWSTMSAPLSSGSIVGVFPVISPNGDNYVAAVLDGKLLLSKNGTGEWQTVFEGDLTGETGGCLMTNEGVIIYSGYYNLFLSGDELENLNRLRLETPVINGVVPLVALHNSTGGEIGAGWYNYVIVYEAKSGDHSTPSQPFTAYRSITTGSTGFTGDTNKVDIENLPVPSDNRIVKKKIYRTRALTTSDLSASPFLYYELATLSPSELTYTDTTADDNLSSSSVALFTVEPVGLSYSFHKGRLFCANIKLPDKNFLSPPVSNDGLATKVFSGTGVITGGEIANASSYRYRMVFVDENGTESDYIETPEILTPGEEYETLALINLEYIPFLPTSETRRIISKRLYRTKKDGSVFYRHPAVIQHNQISFTDIVADTGLDTGSIHSVEIKTREYKSSLVFSEPGKPFTFLPESIISLLPEAGDRIMTLTDDVDGVLIFKQRSIHKLFTSGDSITWRLVTMVEGIGQELINGLLRNRRGIWFFSRGSIYLYNEGSITNIGAPIRNTLGRITKFFSCGMWGQKEWCCFPVEITGGDRYLLIYDLKTNCWYKFTHPDLRGVILFPGVSELLLSYSGGFIVKYDEGIFGSDLIGEADIEINVSLETGKRSSPGLGVFRLRKVWVYLSSIVGGGELVIRTDNGTSSFNFSFADEAEQIKVLPTSGMDNPVDFCREVSLKISGTGIKKLRGLKLETRWVHE